MRDPGALSTYIPTVARHTILPKNVS